MCVKTSMSGWVVNLKAKCELPKVPGTASKGSVINAAIDQVAAVCEEVSRATLEYARQCVNPAELLQHVDTKTEVKRGRAYYRMMEIASKVEEVREGCRKSTLHLCEAPGNFVDSVIAVSNNQADWHAMSLVQSNAPQFYEHLVCAKKANGHARVIFGEKGSGDVLADSNVACVVHEVGGGSAALVTADADLASPALLAAEVRIALLVLAKGGCLVLRLDNDTDANRQMVALALSVFAEVSVHRLAVTNPCDPEWYAVCTRYVGGSAASKKAVELLVEAIANNKPVAATMPDAVHVKLAAIMRWIEHQRAEALTKCAAVARHLHRIQVNDRARTRAHYGTHLVAVPWMLDAARKMVAKFYKHVEP